MDDLSVEPLPSPLVTLAKREEVTEMYRREAWVERSIEDCFRDTGKPPIPVRWVVANKGDALRPNVRYRLVAKHLAAKYGGKDMEDLFAATPPFELMKALLVKAAQRRDRKTTMRKVMFIDVSKAHLYAPVGPDDKAYVALPPECGTPGVCVCVCVCVFSWAFGCMACGRRRTGGKKSTPVNWKRSDSWQVG